MTCLSAPCEEIFWDTTVKLAKNMTLACVYPLVDTVTQTEWFKIKTERESMAIFNPAYHGIIREAYIDRVYFSNHTMTSHDMTLSFHNASEVDVGFYSCFLHTFPHGTWQKVIRVVPPGKYIFVYLCTHLRYLVLWRPCRNCEMPYPILGSFPSCISRFYIVVSKK